MKRHHGSAYRNDPVLEPFEPYPADPEGRPYRSVGLGVPVRSNLEADFAEAAPRQVRLTVRDPAGLLVHDRLHVWWRFSPNERHAPTHDWRNRPPPPPIRVAPTGRDGESGVLLEVPEGAVGVRLAARAKTGALGPGLLTVTLADADDPSDAVQDAYWLVVEPLGEPLRMAGPKPSAAGLDHLRSPRHAAVLALVEPSHAAALLKELAEVLVDEGGDSPTGFLCDAPVRAEEVQAVLARIRAGETEDPRSLLPTRIATGEGDLKGLLASEHWRAGLEAFTSGRAASLCTSWMVSGDPPMCGHVLQATRAHPPGAVAATRIDFAVHVGEQPRPQLMRRLRAVVDAQAARGGVVQALVTRWAVSYPEVGSPFESLLEKAGVVEFDHDGDRRLLAVNPGWLWVGPEAGGAGGRRGCAAGGSGGARRRLATGHHRRRPRR